MAVPSALVCCRAGGTQLLPRVVGRTRAKELIFTGRRVGANEAAHLGRMPVMLAASA
jgi:methylglutaconyl-CoA hydratase